MQTPRRPLGQLRRALLIAAAFSAFSAAALLTGPLFALQLLEAALPAGSTELLLTLLAIGGITLVVAWIIDISRELILVRAGVWIDHTVPPLVIEQGLARGLHADAVRNLVHDVRSMRRALASGAITSVLELPWLLAACGLVALLHPHLAIACAAAVTLPALLCLAGLRRSSASERIASSTWLEQMASQAGTPLGLARKWENLDRRHVGPAYAGLRNRAVSRTLTRLLSAAGLIGLMAYGGTLVVNEALLPGAVVAVVLLVARIAAAIDAIALGAGDIAAARAAWRNIADLDLVMGAAPKVTVPAAPEWIMLENVTAAHAGSRTPAIRDVTLAIAPGEGIGVIGPRGSGKSSLLALIGGHLAPSAGKAVFGSSAIAVLQRRGDRPAIGYLGDSPVLAAGTVAECIAGFTHASDEDVVRAAIRAGATEAIAALPQGYATEVGNGGLGLPMRSRRAIALARALFGNPLAVVLDEPELGLDPTERSRLVGLLEALRRNGATLVIATGDPSLLRLTDRIVLMSNGTIEGVLPSQQITSARAIARQVA